MSKFYTPAWKNRGLLFLKLIEAGADEIEAVDIFKEGRNTKNIFSRTIKPTNWMTKAGYRVKIWSQDEKDTKDTNTLQKLSGAKMLMPLNQKVDEIYKRKYLEFSGLSPDEINSVMELEAEQQQQLINAQGEQAGQPTSDQSVDQNVGPNPVNLNGSNQ